MAIKVRLFLNGEQVDPKTLTISNVTVNRTVNSIIDKMTPTSNDTNKKPPQVA